LVAFTVFLDTTRLLAVATLNMSSGIIFLIDNFLFILVNFGLEGIGISVKDIHHGILSFGGVVFSVEAVDAVAVFCAGFAYGKAVTIELQASGFLAIATELLLLLGQVFLIISEPSVDRVFFRDALGLGLLLSGHGIFENTSL